MTKQSLGVLQHTPSNRASERHPEGLNPTRAQEENTQCAEGINPKETVNLHFLHSTNPNWANSIRFLYSPTLCSGTWDAGFGSLCGRFWHPVHPVHPDGHVTCPSPFVTRVYFYPLHSNTLRKPHPFKQHSSRAAGLPSSMATLFGVLFLVPVNTIAGIMTGVYLVIKRRWRLPPAFIHSQRFNRQPLFKAAVHNLTHGFPPDLPTPSSRLFPELALSRLHCSTRTQRTTR
jgi:hypothetical protein